MFATFHEHIIRVSYGEDDGLTVEEMWAALKEFVQKPQEFIEHLSASDILDKTETETGYTLKRRLHFSQNLVIQDTVDVRETAHEVVTMVEGTKDFPASSFLVKLEEPEKGNLFLRFVYEEEPRNENPMYEEVRKQAYQNKDEFLVKELLQWAMLKRAS